MDVKRAHDIFNSLGVIEVLYQGEPIWIEDIYGDQAKIELLHQRKRTEVPVQDLMESE